MLIGTSRVNGVKEIGVPGLKDSIANHLIEPTQELLGKPNRMSAIKIVSWECDSLQSRWYRGVIPSLC